MVNVKAKPPQGRRSDVVYRIPCNDCALSYKGETQRWLQTRIGDHRRCVTNNSATSALAAHVRDTGHSIDFEGAEVITSEPVLKRRKVKEALSIICDPEGLMPLNQHDQIDRGWRPVLQQFGLLGSSM